MAGALQSANLGAVLSNINAVQLKLDVSKEPLKALARPPTFDAAIAAQMVFPRFP